MPAARKKVAAPEPDTTVRFKLEGKSYEINPERLTFGEIEDLELYFDQAYGEIDFDAMRAVMFLAYLARRRKEPAFTLGEMRALEISELATGDDSPPTDESAPATDGAQS